MQQEKSIPAYRTLEEIRMRKDQLSADIERDSDQIAAIWAQLFSKPENASKGEFAATFIANSITAVDAFLLVRKLMKNYSGLFRFFRKKKSK